MSRRLVLLVSVLSASVLLWAAATALASGYKSCLNSDYYGYGYSYMTSLKESGTTCPTARRVAHKHGHVAGWSCTKKRLDTSPVQYDERVTCRSGGKRVIWTFTQNG